MRCGPSTETRNRWKAQRKSRRATLRNRTRNHRLHHHLQHLCAKAKSKTCQSLLLCLMGMITTVISTMMSLTMAWVMILVLMKTCLGMMGQTIQIAQMSHRDLSQRVWPNSLRKYSVGKSHGAFVSLGRAKATLARAHNLIEHQSNLQQDIARVVFSHYGRGNNVGSRHLYRSWIWQGSIWISMGILLLLSM